MSLGLTFLRRSVHSSALVDETSAKKKSEMDGVCGEKTGRFACHLPRSVWPVPPGEAVSCAGFRRDTGSAPWTAGHWPAALQLEFNNPKGKLGQTGPGSCPETVDVCRRAFHSGNTTKNIPADELQASSQRCCPPLEWQPGRENMFGTYLSVPRGARMECVARAAPTCQTSAAVRTVANERRPQVSPHRWINEHIH